MRGCGKPGCSYFLECSRLRANVGLGTLLIRKGPMEGPRMFWNVLEREKEREASGRRASSLRGALMAVSSTVKMR